MERLSDGGSVKLPVRIPVEWHERLKEYAEGAGVTVSEVVRAAIQEYLRREYYKPEAVTEPEVAQAVLGVSHHPACKCLRCRPAKR